MLVGLEDHKSANKDRLLERYFSLSVSKGKDETSPTTPPPPPPYFTNI